MHNTYPSPRLAAFLLPYVAVGLGLYLLKNAWSSIALYHAGMLAYLVLQRPDGLRYRALTGCPAFPGILLALAAALSGLFLYSLWPFFGISTDQLTQALQRYALTPRSLLIFAVYLGVVHAPLEELYWRTLTAPDTHFITVSDLAFAGYHAFVLILFVPVALALVCVLILGLASAVWRFQARRYGGYALPLLTHVLADLSILACIYHLADF